MGGSWRRQARRVFGTLAATCALLAAVAPMVDAQTAEDDDTPRPEVWSGNASATGVSIELNREALLPIPDVFKFIALDGLGAYGSSSQAARASLLFPGNGGLQGPGLVCGTFGAQFPEEFKPILDQCLKYNYPLTVFADEFRPDASTNGSLTLGKPSDDISANATTARAHAAEDSTTTDAVLQDLRVLGIPPFGPVAIPGGDTLKLDTSIVDVDSSSARTDQRIVKGGLVTLATVKLSGIKLIGGLIRIGSLTSESRVTDDAAGKRTAEATFHATGVTVAGVPAQITDKGLVLGAPNSSIPIPAAAIDAAKAVLKTLDVTASTLPTEETLDKDGAARASVGGLIIHYARDVQGLPPFQGPVGEVDLNGVYTATVQLGLTGVVGEAANFGLDDEGALDDDGALEDVGDFADFGDEGDFSADDSFGDSDFGGAGPVGVGGSRSNTSGGGNGSEDSLVRSISQSFGDRLGFLYLTLMFAVLALCVTPRLAVPPRLPGPKD